jgi:hypothetical protein
VLWGDNFCSWVSIVHELQLRPVVVILSCFHSVDLIKASVRNNCVVVLESDLNPSLLRSLRGLAKLGLVDGRTKSSMCDIALQLGVTCLIGTKTLQRPIAGWTHDKWSFQHCNMGGITTSCMAGCCLALGNEPPRLQALPYLVPQDASSVLCVQAPARKYWPAPS